MTPKPSIAARLAGATEKIGKLCTDLYADPDANLDRIRCDELPAIRKIAQEVEELAAQARAICAQSLNKEGGQHCVWCEWADALASKPEET